MHTVNLHLPATAYIAGISTRKLHEKSVYLSLQSFDKILANIISFISRKWSQERFFSSEKWEYAAVFPKMLGLDLSMSDVDWGHPALEAECALGSFHPRSVFCLQKTGALQATEHATWIWDMAGLRSTANLITATETNIWPVFLAEIRNYNSFSQILANSIDFSLSLFRRCNCCKKLIFSW